MPFEVKGVPKSTCSYRLDKDRSGILQSGCSGDWLVLQESFTHCPFCGDIIERNPPPKPRLSA